MKFGGDGNVSCHESCGGSMTLHRYQISVNCTPKIGKFRVNCI